MDDYVSWDLSTPGISFNVVTGRIRLFKTTLQAMGYPEHYRFLFNPEDRMFAVEACGIDDEGANRLPDEFPRDHYEIKCMGLVRFVFQTCGWQKKLTYRIPGEVYSPDSHLVYFDLQKAYEIHEGRMKEAAEL